MKRIEVFLSAWILAALAPIVLVVTRNDKLDFTDISLLIASSVVMAIPPLLIAISMRYFIPIINDARTYWNEMPKEDREELKRTLERAARILLNKAGRDGNPIAILLLWILKLKDNEMHEAHA